MINSREGEIFINGVDAFTRYGVFFDETSISSLLTPAPMKESPSDDSPLIDGIVTDTSNPKLDKRSFTLLFNITAESVEDFFKLYDRFCEEVLYKKSFTLKCAYFPNKLFRLEYVDCSQFQEFYLTGIGKYQLRVSEPNPANRSIDI